MKQRIWKSLSMMLVLVMLLVGCSKPANVDTEPKLVTESVPESEDESVNEQDEADELSLKDDFYEFINQEWIDSIELLPSEMAVNSMSQMQDGITELLRNDFDQMMNGDGDISPELGEFLKLYTLALDYDTRNELGASPLMPYLEELEALDSIEALGSIIADRMVKSLPVPFSFGVRADMANATTNALYANSASVILPDVTYYGTEIGDQLLAYYAMTVTPLLQMVGYSDEEAEKLVTQALAYDESLVPYTKSMEEASEYASTYNPVDGKTFTGYSSSFNLNAVITELTGSMPEMVVVTNPKFFEALDTLMNNETFENLKSWLIVETVFKMSSYLSEEFRETAGAYGMLLTGRTEMGDKNEAAYNLASVYFLEIIGNYYGETYFGDEAKADVTRMIENMIEVYVERLKTNEWLSDKTIEAAIRKLETMSVQVGYPDQLDPIYSQFIVTESENGGTFLGNIINFSEILFKDHFSKAGQPVDRDAWTLSADMVNAMYSPTNNAIMFPAAILQEPFYSMEQSASANYGGIGAVIAHEITHAFDNNGSQFDEYGNLSNWWTEEDFAAFAERTQAMVGLFDGIEHAGSTVNGTMTVAENIADAGGLSCALEVVKSLPDGNLEEFFTNWAVIWRMVSTEQYEQFALSSDVHSPNKLRANIQLMNIDEFYETFDIQEGDQMFLPQDQRIKIW